MIQEQLIPIRQEELVKLFLETVLNLKTEIAELRAENVELRAENAELRAENAELRARLDKDSHNSSKPPSSDGLKPAPKSLREKSGKKPGAQKGHKGHGLVIDNEPDKIIRHETKECPCGANLEDVIGTVTVAGKVIEIKITTEVILHQAIKKKCPCCGSICKAKLPEGVKSGQQYGNSIKLWSGMMTNWGMVSVDRTHKILNDFFELPISTGTIMAIGKEFSKKVEPCYEQIKEMVQQSSVVHADETGVKIKGKLNWVHNASTKTHTCLSVDAKRGVEGINNAGILTKVTGTVVHDCWKPYWKIGNYKHALCNAHLLRELIAVDEQFEQKWAPMMNRFLIDCKKFKELALSKGEVSLSYDTLEKCFKKYDEIIALGKVENPVVGKSKKDKGGRKKGTALCLLERFEKYKDEILTFMINFDVPFDNNQAERDVRMFKVKQKVSGGFRTIEGARGFAKAYSVISTSLKNHKSPVEIFKKLFRGEQVVFG